MDIEKISKKEHADAQYEPNCIHLFDTIFFSSLWVSVSKKH